MGAKVVAYRVSNTGKHWALRKTMPTGWALVDSLVTLSDYDALKALCNVYQRQHAELSDRLNGTPCAEVRWRQEKEALEAKLREAQARIDALMLEHCPEDMTPEQMAEWAKHQAPGDDDV